MTETGFWRGYWPLLLTLVAGQLSQQIDIVLMGRLGGSASGAYVMLARLAFLELVLMTAMSAVASTTVAQAQCRDQAGRAINNALVLAAVAGTCSSVIGFLFYSRAAKWLLGETEVTALIDANIFWFSMGAPPRFLTNVAVFILHALGHGVEIVRWKLIEVTLCAATNLAFVGVFGWGMFGCFFAAFVVSIVSLIWCWRRLASHQVRWRFAPDRFWTRQFLRSTAWESQRNITVHLALATSLALFAAPWIGRYEAARLNSYSAGQTFILLAFAPLIALTRFLAFRLSKLREEARDRVARLLWVNGTPISILIGAMLFESEGALGQLYGQQGAWWSVLIQALAISLPIRYATNVLRALFQSRSAFGAVAAADGMSLWFCGVPLVALGLYADAPHIAYLSLILPEVACGVLLWRRLSSTAPTASRGFGALCGKALGLKVDVLRLARWSSQKGAEP